MTNLFSWFWYQQVDVPAQQILVPTSRRTCSADLGCLFTHVYSISCLTLSGYCLFLVFRASTLPLLSPRFRAKTSHSLPAETNLFLVKYDLCIQLKLCAQYRTIIACILVSELGLDWVELWHFITTIHHQSLRKLVTSRRLGVWKQDDTTPCNIVWVLRLSMFIF